MGRGPARTSRTPGRTRPPPPPRPLLPLLPLLLLLLRGAGGDPPEPAPPAPAARPAAARTPRGALGDAASALGLGAPDAAAAHMLRLYDKYGRRGARPGGGNTVRSFRARLDTVDQRPAYVFNLTSLQDSEVILSATFHLYMEPHWPRAREEPCRQRVRSTFCHLPPPGPPARRHLLFRSIAQNTAAQGLLRGALALAPPLRGLWQARDISPIVRAARQAGELLLWAQLDPAGGAPGAAGPSAPLPYLLVYADDLAIAEPNSVAGTLQRYDPLPAADPEPHAADNGSADPRVRRASQAPGPLQDNELPGLHERPGRVPPARQPPRPRHELWRGPLGALKPRPGRRERRRKGPDAPAASRVLDFDEQTMRKARRRQWAEPRVCSRRYLRVDFADIGWNEWIVLPKSFDAYYCAGECEFPMPKVVRPSNHATIQSIVRAVGIVPGIPEPCCVPDKMNSLGVLFLDENRDVVLKVYPNMSVETCACR
ncbi:growth/differentiation factor 10 [Vulpes lagopus]|uniref:growth/differentiation factor 10 n=1 Tax=Vulpes lagopus TaxID=494514 RepID=UPI001BCA310A|nr:growth/differentiation factor 10 [Vulpes lagopus]